MKKILIAIDYNPQAEKVAEMGYTLARALSAEVSIIHVITEPAYYAMEYSPIMGYQGGYGSAAIAVFEDIKTEAKKFLAACVKRLADNNIKTVLLDGDATGSILQYSIEWNADLIVIGSHNHKGIDRLFVTDVAVHVLKHSKIPVLIIPTKED